MHIFIIRGLKLKYIDISFSILSDFQFVVVDILDKKLVLVGYLRSKFLT